MLMITPCKCNRRARTLGSTIFGLGVVYEEKWTHPQERVMSRLTVFA